MNARSLFTLVAFSIGAIASCPRLAHAQQVVSDADRNAARDLYVEGVALQKAGKYTEALDRFQRSLAVYPVAPTTAYHMAQCKEALGQLVEAAEQLRLVRDTPLPPGASEAFNEAKQDAAVELQSLEARIPKIKINVLPAGIQGLQVTIDGTMVPTALVGVARPINPGSHRVGAAAPGYTAAQQQVDVRERQQPPPEITLTLQPGGPAGYPNTNPNTGVGTYPNTGGYPPNDGSGGYQGGAGYNNNPPYGQWVAPRRPPQGPRNALMIGIDGVASFPFGNVRDQGSGGPNCGVSGPGSTCGLPDYYGPIGFGFGVDVGLRLARILYLGVNAQGSFFNGNSSALTPTTGGFSFALDGVLGLMSNPEGVGIYGEIGGGIRTIALQDKGQTTLTGDVMFGLGVQVKAGSFRFIPKLDLYVGPNDGDLGHGFFTLGIAGFWELPLDKPVANVNATAQPAY